MNYDPENVQEWVKYWLPLMEHKIDERRVMLLKLRNGMIDGILHSYSSMGLSVKNKSKENGHLSATRAKDVYDQGIRNLRFYVGRYMDENSI